MFLWSWYWCTASEHLKWEKSRVNKEQVKLNETQVYNQKWFYNIQWTHEKQTRVLYISSAAYWYENNKHQQAIGPNMALVLSDWHSPQPPDWKISIALASRCHEHKVSKQQSCVCWTPLFWLISARFFAKNQTSNNFECSCLNNHRR